MPPAKGLDPFESLLQFWWLCSKCDAQPVLHT
uniref:AMT6 n=1 Tax=Arundo donax TaxID=35708 RepID=A0A0A8Z465_ARUDO